MYDAGGGGGALRYDTAAMSEAACALRSVTGSLESTAGSAPACGNYGDASPLIAMMIGAFADATARVAAEAALLGDIVDTCSAGIQRTDAQVAAAVLTNGVRP